MYGSVAERFWNNVIRDPDTECWIWVGNIEWFGHGSLHVGRTMKKAHRVSYEMHVGPIPAGYHVHHKCRVPACVNPDHLVALTPKAHSAAHADMQRHCKHGHPLPPYEGKRRQCAICNRERGERFRRRHGQTPRELWEAGAGKRGRDDYRTRRAG